MPSDPYQIMSRYPGIATPQEMEPMNTWSNQYQSIEEDDLQSIVDSYVNYSHDNPADMQSAGQFNEAFIDPSLILSTYVQPPRQFTEASVDQSPHIPIHIQPPRQSTGPFVDQSVNITPPMPPAGQLTGPVIDQSPNIPTHMLPAGQLTGPFIDQSLNVPTPMPPAGQATPAPARYSGNGMKNMQAARKSCPASAQGRKKHPAVVKDKDIERSAGEYNISYDEMMILKDYANARLKGIETSEPKDAPSRYIISRFEKVRREHSEHATWPYDIPKEKIIRLLPGQKRQDRAPIKSHHSACETRREELDARYHESRQWEGPPPPTPNQTNQNTLTAPSTNDIPTGLTPPPSPARPAGNSPTMQHDSMNFSDDNPPSAASYDVRTDGSEGGVQLPLPLPPPSTTLTQPDSSNTRSYLVNGRAASDDVHMAGTEEPAQMPLSLPTSTPREQRSEDLLNDSDPSIVSDDSQYDYLFEEPDQASSPLPTFKLTEEGDMEPVANSNLPAVSDDNELDKILEEQLQIFSDSELKGFSDESTQQSPPLPPFMPTEQDNMNLPDNSNQPAVPDNSKDDELFGQSLQSLDDELDEFADEQTQRSLEHVTHWPFHQDRSKEGHPFTLPNFESWPVYAPIICHPLVRALELHAGRKDPFVNETFKGYTIPVANYKARGPQRPASADSSSKPKAEFMPQGYEMTEELTKEIEQRIVMYMRRRWGMHVSDDDFGKKARSGELVREDLSRLGKQIRGWRYSMVYWVQKWGFGGVQGSELSEDCTIQLLCSGKIGF